MFRQKGLALPALAIVASGLIAIACPADTARVSRATVHDKFDLLTGQYWHRTVDPRHPAAPPRLVTGSATNASDSGLKRPHPPCLRAGDRLLLQAGGVDSILRMEATALESGAAGDTVRARVMVTGADVEITIVDATSGLLLGPVRGRQ